MIRMAMIGCGGMARNYMVRMRELDTRLDFTALVDVDEARARHAAEPWPKARVATDYHDILNDVDAVILALPHHLHHRVALDCLKAGKHVLVEKPLANTERECLDLIEAQKKSGCVLMVGYVMRYDPLWIEMGRLIREKTFGDVFHVSIWTEQFTKLDRDWVNRAEMLGGGQLFSHGCHYIDLLLHWMGNPVSGTHVGTNFGTPWMDMEGTSNVAMKFDNGATAYHFGTWGARGTRLRYAVHAHCTQGLLELDHLRGSIVLHRDPSGSDLPALAANSPAGAKLPTAKETVVFAADRKGKATNHEVAHLLDCIENHREPRTNARESLQGLRAIWRLYAAEHLGVVADLRGCGLEEITPAPDPVLTALHCTGTRVPALQELAR